MSSRVESLLKMLDVDLNIRCENVEDILIHPDMINYDNLKRIKKSSIDYLLNEGVK